jgi:hypothetical protein
MDKEALIEAKNLIEEAKKVNELLPEDDAAMHKAMLLKLREMNERLKKMEEIFNRPLIG